MVSRKVSTLVLLLVIVTTIIYGSGCVSCSGSVIRKPEMYTEVDSIYNGTTYVTDMTDKLVIKFCLDGIYDTRHISEISMRIKIRSKNDNWKFVLLNTNTNNITQEGNEVSLNLTKELVRVPNEDCLWKISSGYKLLIVSSDPQKVKEPEPVTLDINPGDLCAYGVTITIVPKK